MLAFLAVLACFSVAHAEVTFAAELFDAPDCGDGSGNRFYLNETVLEPEGCLATSIDLITIGVSVECVTEDTGVASLFFTADCSSAFLLSAELEANVCTSFDILTYSVSMLPTTLMCEFD